jgi:hypothetical protein
VNYLRIWPWAALAGGALTVLSCSGESLGGPGSGGRGAGGALGGNGPFQGFGGSIGAGGGPGPGGAPSTGGIMEGAGRDGQNSMGGSCCGPDGLGGGGGAGGLAGSGGAAGAGAIGSGGRVGTGGCNSIDFDPPVLNVFDAQTGAPICDPTFAIIVPTDGGSMSEDAGGYPCTPSTYDCPVFHDGGATCPFELTALAQDSTGSTVEVSAPGYEPREVSGVAGGTSGCIPPFITPSHLDVKLVPLPSDAGTTSDANAPASCSEIASEYASALPAALGCHVGGYDQCAKEVPLSLDCGCVTFVNDSTALDTLQGWWQSMGCTTGPGCPTGCAVYAAATCLAGEGGVSTCQRTP